MRQTGRHNVQSRPNIDRADGRFEHAVASLGLDDDPDIQAVSLTIPTVCL